MIERTILQDVPIGAQHTLRNKGEHIMRLLSQGAQLTAVYATATRHHISKQDVHELLGLLNLLGALQRTRNAKQQLYAWAIQSKHLFLGIRYTPVTWRRTAHTLSLWVAIMRATVLVMAASLLVSTFIVASGLLPALQTVGIACLALGLFVTSLFIHELAHLLGIQHFHATPVLLQRGMRLGIVHPPLPSKAEINIALAGPACGIGACLLAARVCLFVDQPVAAIICGIVGAFHISSLLPWYSDGVTLQKALRGS